jgi:glycosyltransferase involved in cell wall biosynthesis
MKKNIYIAFNIQNSAVSDYYIRLGHLLKERYNVFIFTSKTEFITQKNLQGLKVFIWPSKRPTKLKDFIFLSKKILEYRPVTMIAAFGAVNLFAIVGYLFFIRNRIAWVHSVSTHMASRKLLQYRKSLVYKACSLIVANSLATKNDTILNFAVRANKIKVVYNSSDLPEEKDADVNFNRITFAGRIHPSKGIDVLIKAMSIVIKKYPDLKLEIVGAFLKGEAVQKYIQLTQDLGLTNHIDFIGWKSKTELLDIFRNSYFTVVPSLAEAFGYVVIESFSVKTPVIGSNTGGIAEIIRDGKDGLLFPPGNHEELAQKMILLLSNTELRQQLSEYCHLRFKEHFESEKVLHKFIDYLQSIS